MDTSAVKRMLDSFPYVFSFICVEVVVFVALYFFHSLMFKGFGFSEALVKGGYEFLWRVVSLQLIIQLLLFLFAANFELHKNYAVILVLSILAFSIASVFSFSDVSSIWKLMQIPNENDMGEGFVFLISVSFAYMLYLFLGMLDS